ncbi:hypothetical protein ACTU44_21830 (plasmid) [Thalassospira sp. SM2505]
MLVRLGILEKFNISLGDRLELSPGREKAYWLLSCLIAGLDRVEKQDPSSYFAAGDAILSEKLNEDGPRQFRQTGRQAKTRTIIQAGGVLWKSGFPSWAGIEMGKDLQRDRKSYRPVASLFGCLSEMPISTDNRSEPPAEFSLDEDL